MGVYFRTGDRSAVGVSWPFYFLVVLPVQAVVFFAKALVMLFVLAATGVIWVCSWGYGRWVEHRESRPPAA